VSVSVFIATSLDGFIARSDGALDWLPMGGSDDHGYAAFISRIDAIVMGRKTFETVLTFDPWPYGSTPVVVLSSQAESVRIPVGSNASALTGEPAAIIAQLMERGLEHLYLDGGLTIQRFLVAGLVDRMIITRVPVMLGSGIPLFGPLARDLRFAHVSTTTFPDGLVQTEYRAVQ
jgi:dihydrofolate reductase